jgi:PRTRC genetic system ThiF family protein
MNNPISIVLVGVGGTGSHMLNRLAVLNDNLIKLGYPGIELVAFDPDIVTKTNVGRQTFTYDDVDYPKVFAMIERINEQYGFSWEGRQKKFDWNDLEYLINHQGFLISCVDNVDTRKNIYRDYFNNNIVRFTSRVPYWIDVGNGDFYGQIVMGCNITNNDLPNIIEVFPKLDDYQDHKTSSGCSTMDAILKQSLYINDIMATLTANMLKEFIINMYIEYSMMFINLKTFEINTK